jgi:hypothetical protein
MTNIKCRVKGCARFVTRPKKRVCNSCTNRKSEGKSYPINPVIIKPLEERFWSRIKKDEGDCWIWTGGTTGAGYGAIQDKGKFILAHRLSWGLHYGEIPIGMFVCHTCDNPPCVNPLHLFIGSCSDNMKDKSKKGRAKGAHEGNDHPMAKLTVIKVKEIKKLIALGERTYILARNYGVSQPTICDIKYNRVWRHVL